MSTYDRLLSIFRDVAEPDSSLEERISTCAAMLDRADDCAAQVANDGLLVRGSAGQWVSHPLLAEERNLRVQADRIWTESLPAETGETEEQPSRELSIVSLRAQQAAQARWGRHRAAGDI